MKTIQKIEIIFAGNLVKKETTALAKRNLGAQFEVTALDLKDPLAVQKAKDLGIRFLPIAVIDGKPTHLIETTSLAGV